MFSLYMQFVTENPILSAIIQFALLGTLGEMVSRWVQQRKIFLPFTLRLILWKMLTWSILAVLIKYAFTGYKGFVDTLMEHNYLPQDNGVFRAFFISTAMNLQFGLLLVILHRILDNIPEKQGNWNNIQKSMYSLIWFWIPAHTVTFIMPRELQIGLAALWSVALGLILGLNKKSVPAPANVN